MNDYARALPEPIRYEWFRGGVTTTLRQNGRDAPPRLVLTRTQSSTSLRERKYAAADAPFPELALIGAMRDH